MNMPRQKQTHTGKCAIALHFTLWQHNLNKLWGIKLTINLTLLHTLITLSLILHSTAVIRDRAPKYRSTHINPVERKKSDGIRKPMWWHFKNAFICITLLGIQNVSLISFGESILSGLPVCPVAFCWQIQPTLPHARSICSKSKVSAFQITTLKFYPSIIQQTALWISHQFYQLISELCSWFK